MRTTFVALCAHDRWGLGCRWSMDDRETYCANKKRIVLYRGTSAYKGSLSECAALAEKNKGCGLALYYA